MVPAHKELTAQLGDREINMTDIVAKRITEVT